MLHYVCEKWKKEEESILFWLAYLIDANPDPSKECLGIHFCAFLKALIEWRLK